MKTRTGMRERKVMWLKFQQRSELCVSQSAIYEYSNSTDARRINRKSVWVIFCNFPPDLSKPRSYSGVGLSKLSAYRSEPVLVVVWFRSYGEDFGVAGVDNGLTTGHCLLESFPIGHGEEGFSFTL